MPTSPELLKKVTNLEGVKNCENPNWNDLLDISSTYNLLYTLSIKEWLMDEDEDIDNKWRTGFIMYNGFTHFADLFKKFSEF